MKDYTNKNVISLFIPKENEPFLYYDPIEDFYSYKLHNVILDGYCNYPKQNSYDFLNILKDMYAYGNPFNEKDMRDIDIADIICDKFNESIANNIIKTLKIKNDLDKPKIREYLYANYIHPHGLTMRVNGKNGDFSQYVLATIVVNETDFLYIQSLFC